MDWPYLQTPGLAVIDIANCRSGCSTGHWQRATNAAQNGHRHQRRLQLPSWLSPLTARLLAVIIGDTVKLFNVASGQETGTAIPIKEANAIAISPDGKSLYTAGWTGPIIVWDIASGAQVRTFGDPNRGGVNRDRAFAGWQPAGLSRWGVDGPDHTVDATSGRQLRTFPAHGQRDGPGLLARWQVAGIGIQ